MRPEFNEDDQSASYSAGPSDANDNPEIEVTEDELAALRDEVDVLHGGDLIEMSDNLLREKTLSAITSISKLATGAAAERVRLDASKYIVERVLGPLAKIDHTSNPENDPMLKLLEIIARNQK